MSVFGTWLQAQIDALGWDQRLAGQRIGVPETSIHNWLHQDIKPSVRNVLKIAKALKAPIEVVLQQAGYDDVLDGPTATPDELGQQRAQVLAALPQFADIIDLLAKKPPEQQAAYLEMIRRLLVDPGPRSD